MNRIVGGIIGAIIGGGIGYVWVFSEEQARINECNSQTTQIDCEKPFGNNCCGWVPDENGGHCERCPTGYPPFYWISDLRVLGLIGLGGLFGALIAGVN